MLPSTVPPANYTTLLSARVRPRLRGAVAVDVAVAVDFDIFCDGFSKIPRILQGRRATADLENGESADDVPAADCISSTYCCSRLFDNSLSAPASLHEKRPTWPWIILLPVSSPDKILLISTSRASSKSFTMQPVSSHSDHSEWTEPQMPPDPQLRFGAR